MSEKISWFGDERKKPKEIIGNTKDTVVGLGKVVLAGLCLGVGIKAFGEVMD